MQKLMLCSVIVFCLGSQLVKADENERVFLVVASFSDIGAAMDLERSLEQTLTGVHTQSELVGGALRNRVMIGPVEKSRIDRMKLLLRSQGVPDVWILPADQVEFSSSEEADLITSKVSEMSRGQDDAMKSPQTLEKAAAPKERDHYNPATLVLPDKKRRD